MRDYLESKTNSFLMQIALLAILLFSGTLFIINTADIIFGKKEIKYTCVMVDKTYGNPLRSGKIGTYYWAVIEGKIIEEYPASKTIVYKFLVGYHLSGCEHNIDFRNDSETRKGTEFVYLWPLGELIVLEDNLTEFDTHYVIAKELIEKYKAGARLTW